MKLSFGMIFSIILIIIFIAFAFYAILKFLGLQDSVKLAQFGDDLQSDIDKMWKGSQGSQEVEYSLPTKIRSVCFKDEEYENMVFRSDKFVEGRKIEHIDIENTLAGEDSFCIENINGKVKMVIEKEYGEALVTIKNEK